MAQLRILIVSTFFPPLNSIASLRPHSWAKYWAQAGHDVTILTTEKQQDSSVQLHLPCDSFRVIETPYPRFIRKLKTGYHEEKASSEPDKKPHGLSAAIKKGFHYLRYQKGVFHACRMPDMADLWAPGAYKKIQTMGPWDCVVSTAGPYTVHLLAYLLKKQKLTKTWIADYRDTWSNNYIYPGIFPFNKLESWLENRVLKKADAVTTVSDPFSTILAEKFHHHHVHTIANGFDPEDLLHLSKAPIFLQDGKFRIVHTGSIYAGKRDPSPLFQAIQNMNKDTEKRGHLGKLEVIFAGANQGMLDDLITRYDVSPWVRSAGFVSRDDALRMQRDAHALLFLPWNDASIDGVLTGKIFEYLFSGTPILAVGGTSLEASQKLILDASAGVALFSPEEIEHYLAVKLSNVTKSKTDSSAAFLLRYTRKHLAATLFNVMEQAMEKNCANEATFRA